MTEIRPATPTELPAVGELARAALGLDADDAPRLVARLSAPPVGRLWIALVTPGLDGVAFASTSATPGVGHVDLLAVRPSAQGRGIGAALVRAAEDWLREWGVHQARLAGNPPCYAWPGIDVRYTPAICLAERLGYERFRIAWNMTADLTGTLPRHSRYGAGPAGAPPSPEDLSRLDAAGVTLHTALPGERTAVARFVREHWNEAWAWEAEQATGCHYAARQGEIIGFAAWGSRPAWFGPMGTAEAARGLGVGGVLLRRCLHEQAAAGLRSTQIGWVGPVGFYAKTVGARVERGFWLYGRSLA